MFTIISSRQCFAENTTSSEKVDAILEGLSDAEIRNLLIQEFRKEVMPREEPPATTWGGFNERLQGWLHLIDGPNEEAPGGISGFFAAIPDVPHDIIQTFAGVRGGEEGNGLFFKLLFMAAIFGLGFGLELVFRKMTAPLKSQLILMDQGTSIFW